jgi:hypothetical protein
MSGRKDMRSVLVQGVLLVCVVLSGRALSADIQHKLCLAPNGETLNLTSVSQKFKYEFWVGGIPKTESGQFKTAAADLLKFPDGTLLSTMGVARRAGDWSTISFTFTSRSTRRSVTVEFSKSKCVRYPF